MTRTLAVGGALVFCTFVAVLLIILYYPKDIIEKEFDEFEKRSPTVKIPFDIVNFNSEPPDRTSKLDDLAKQVEEFGAAFLTLLAVGLVTVGLTCLVCACCCLA